MEEARSVAQQIPLEHFLVLSALLFSIGVYGVLTRRNAVLIIMSVELMLNAAAINLVAFAAYTAPERFIGMIFAIFIITDRRGRGRPGAGDRAARLPQPRHGERGRSGRAEMVDTRAGFGCDGGSPRRSLHGHDRRLDAPALPGGRVRHPAAARAVPAARGDWIAIARHGRGVRPASLPSSPTSPTRCANHGAEFAGASNSIQWIDIPGAHRTSTSASTSTRSRW